MVKLFRKNSNLCDHNPPTLQTDRQTTCDRKTALCTKVSDGTGVVCFSSFFWLRVLDKAEYSAFQSTLNSPIVSYRMYGLRNSERGVLVYFNSVIKRIKQCCCTLILLPESTLNANLTTTNRFFTNYDWQRGWFENFEPDNQYESNIESDVRFEIESNHEASQFPKTNALMPELIN